MSDTYPSIYKYYTTKNIIIYTLQQYYKDCYILSGALTAIRFSADFKIIVTSFTIANLAHIKFLSSTRTFEYVY